MNPQSRKWKEPPVSLMDQTAIRLAMPVLDMTSAMNRPLRTSHPADPDQAERIWLGFPTPVTI
jgi:hypothetical protein